MSDPLNTPVTLSDLVVDYYKLFTNQGTLVSYTPVEATVNVEGREIVVGNEEVLEGLPDDVADSPPDAGVDGTVNPGTSPAAPTPPVDTTSATASDASTESTEPADTGNVEEGADNAPTEPSTPAADGSTDTTSAPAAS